MLETVDRFPPPTDVLPFVSFFGKMYTKKYYTIKTKYTKLACTIDIINGS